MLSMLCLSEWTYHLKRTVCLGKKKSNILSGILGLLYQGHSFHPGQQCGGLYQSQGFGVQTVLTLGS